MIGKYVKCIANKQRNCQCNVVKQIVFLGDLQAQSNGVVRLLCHTLRSHHPARRRQGSCHVCDCPLPCATFRERAVHALRLGGKELPSHRTDAGPWCAECRRSTPSRTCSWTRWGSPPGPRGARWCKVCRTRWAAVPLSGPRSGGEPILNTERRPTRSDILRDPPLCLPAASTTDRPSACRCPVMNMPQGVISNPAYDYIYQGSRVVRSTLLGHPLYRFGHARRFDGSAIRRNSVKRLFGGVVHRFLCGAALMYSGFEWGNGGQFLKIGCWDVCQHKDVSSLHVSDSSMRYHGRRQRGSISCYIYIHTYI